MHDLLFRLAATTRSYFFKGYSARKTDFVQIGLVLPVVDIKNKKFSLQNSTMTVELPKQMQETLCSKSTSSVLVVHVVPQRQEGEQF